MMVNGTPAQRVIDPRPVRLTLEDLSEIESGALDAAIGERIQLEVDTPCDRRRGPLFRTRLFRAAPAKHFFAFIVDHIVFGGTSFGILVKELRVLYDAFAADRPSPLQPLGIQLVDYAVWQRQHFTTLVVEREQAYWREHLLDAPRQIRLPFDRPRNGMQASEVVEFLHSFGHLADAWPGGVFINLLTALFSTLYANSGQEDLVIGLFHGNRSQELLDVIGDFAALAPIRARVVADDTLASLREKIGEEMSVLEHLDIDHRAIIEAVNPPRTPGLHPLFNVAFNPVNMNVAFDTVDDKKADAGKLQISGVPLLLRRDPRVFDLIVSVLLTDSGNAWFCFEYNAKLFDRTTIERLTRSYVEIVGQLVHQSERPLSRLPAGPEPAR
jgi:hypothetical protein